jgi:predicted protein tyrosine phosphatase
LGGQKIKKEMVEPTDFKDEHSFLAREIYCVFYFLTKFMEKQKLLFVCSQNKRRSLTAEKMFANSPDFAVKSAGTENNSRVKITAGLIGWADRIFVMERKHRDRLKQKFGDELTDKQVITLNIPDDYEFMQPELIDILENYLAHYFES